MTERNPPPTEMSYQYSDEPVPTPPPAANRTGRIAGLLVLAGLLLLLGWVAIKGFRVYQATQGLLAIQDEAQSLMAGGLQSIDTDSAVALVTSARDDIDVLNRELAFLGPLAPVMGALPRVGPLAVAAPHLLDMAAAGSDGGALAAEALAPALAIIQQNDFGANQIGDLLPIIQAAAPQLEAASRAPDGYAAARTQLDTAVNVDDLPWRVRQLVVLADEWLPAGRAGLGLAPQLPLLLGANGPRRYLIMAQNEDELRATGGFLTGAGVLTIENGRILDLSLKDANTVDNWRDKPYDAPPQPLSDFMLLDLFLFRDANFWPDFPRSAQQAMALYTYGQDESALNGAIAIDQEFLRLLVDATGPIAVNGGRDINASNLIRTLQRARDPEEGQEVGDWVDDRKAFLSGFAGAIRAKLESDFSSVNPVKLGRNMITALDGHHLQIYMQEPAIDEKLAKTGWDGRLPSAPPGDFWMVVDSNMGFNKANFYIDRSFDYAIDLSSAAAPVARLSVVYTHTGELTDAPCYQGVEDEFEQGAGYLALADKCYWNYVRVYTPAGSTLASSSRHTVAADTLFSNQTWDSEATTIAETEGLTTFANFMLVPQGKSAEFFVGYTVPTGVIQQQTDGSMLYELRVQKQAGTRPEAIRIAITLPPGTEVLEAGPTPIMAAGNQVLFDTSLEANTVFRVRFR